MSPESAGDSVTYKYAKVAESQRNDPRNDNPEGTRTLVFGKETDPDYTVLTEDKPIEITHEVIKTIEAPERLSREDFTEYIRSEVLPLDIDDSEGSA